MKKVFKWLGIALLAGILLGGAGFLIWAETPSQPGQAALAALKSDDKVTITDQGKYISFEPAGTTATATTATANSASTAKSQ